MNKSKRLEIFQRLRQENPNPTTELEFNSTFQLLIAVILSAQATDKGVNKATKKLFIDTPTADKMLALGLDGLKKYIKTIGLYNNKAKNILITCKILVDQHHNKVPDNREDLEALAGVGRKTANVVLNTAFNQPTMAVDTHIFRVSNRTKIAKGKNPLEVEKNLLKNIPKDFLLNAHHWLILHGRYTCIARKPRCESCIIEDLCEYKEKNIS